MSKVKIQTSQGDIIVRLYDETPLHRDNFLKLAKEGYYDGSFHGNIRCYSLLRSKTKRLGFGSFPQ